MATAAHPVFSRISALIVDDQSAMRTLHKNQLQDIGIERIELASSPGEALATLRTQQFDLVLCDHDLKSHTDGQQLLELLRDENVLPAATLFVMITGNNVKGDVAATTEHQPDDYILKPITVRGLEDRLLAILKRRAALGPVLQLMRDQDFEGAVQLCDELLAQKSPYPSELRRRKAECLLELGRMAEARQVYEEVGKANSKLAWAKMGEARACYLDGQVDTAKTLVKSLIATHDQNMPAYEFLAKMAEETGQLGEAMAVLTRAAGKVGSARRHRALGQMAVRTGQLDVAKESLKQAFKLSKGSIVAQSDDALMLAQVHVDLGESKDAHQILDEAGPGLKADPAAQRGAAAVRSQAFREQGEVDAADKALQFALDGVEARADTQSILIAKAALLSSDPALVQQGARLLEQAIQEDHENDRVIALARRALVDTGHPELIATLVDASTEGLKAEVAQSKALLRSREFSRAVEQLDALLGRYANNTAVLIETVRAYLLEMSFTGITAAKMGRAEQLLARLDSLPQRSDQVQLLHQFLARVKAKNNRERRA
jgi:DNA-binding response OmpR family regulator